MFMFKMAQQLGIDICFKCHKTIETVAELSIEHKTPWIDKDIETFWDLDNVAFAHLHCNTTSTRRDTDDCIAYQNSRWPYPEGYAKCYFCSVLKPFDNFHKDPTKKRGIRLICKPCLSTKNKNK